MQLICMKMLRCIDNEAFSYISNEVIASFFTSSKVGKISSFVVNGADDSPQKQDTGGR